MTGQAQTGGFSPNDFKNAVCARIYGLFDCPTACTSTSRTIRAFCLDQHHDADDQRHNSTRTKIGFQIRRARAASWWCTLYYQWPIYVSLLGNNLSNLNGGNRLLVATAVFRNEPY